MKLAIIETNNTIADQIEKIDSELSECADELYKDGFSITKEAQLEALDILTASMNLVYMLNIPDEVLKEHEEKMKRYEVEKGYKILKTVEVKDSQPMKINQTYEECDCHVFNCPSCKTTWIYNETGEYKYCPECGQKLEWESDEE